MRINLPPLTRTLLIGVLSLSLAVATVRYHTYYVWSKHVEEQDRITLEQATSHELGDGRNFPPEQKTLDKVPSASYLYVPFLTIVPGKSLIFYPWILVTASFVEESVVALLFTATTLFYGARYCEYVWGSKELARFVLLQSVVPNVIALFFYSLVYKLANTPPTSVVTICGSTALVAGFLVSFKQLVPEHLIVILKFIRIKVKYLPITFLVISTLMGLVVNDLYAIHAWTGFFCSWIYLRFIRITYTDPVLPFNNSSPSVHQHTNVSDGIKVRGDASDSFALSEFFPEVLQHAIEKVSDATLILLSTLHIIRPFTQEEIDSANQRALARVSISQNNPNQLRRSGPSSNRGSARAEAERRRSLALRALNS